MRLLSSQGLDRQPRPLPLRVADVQAPRLQAATLEQTDGVVGIDAVGTAAIGDDLAPPRQLADESVELVNGSRKRTGDMAGAKLRLGPHVEHDHIATLEPQRKLL